MGEVTNAFIGSPNFERGAMFINYDEWGGFFDHVSSGLRARRPPVAQARQELRHQRLPGSGRRRLPVRAARCRQPHDGHPRIDPEADLVPLRARLPEQAPPLRLQHRLHASTGRTRTSRIPSLPSPLPPVTTPCSLQSGAGSETKAMEEQRGARRGRTSARPSAASTSTASGTTPSPPSRRTCSPTTRGGLAPPPALGPRVKARGLIVAVLCAAIAAFTPPGASAKPAPHLKHVFIIVLENQNYDGDLRQEAGLALPGESPAQEGRAASRSTTRPRTSRARNYMAMISGQAPERRHPVRLPGLQRLRARDGHARAACTSGRAASTRTGSRRSPNQLEDHGLHVEGLHAGHERRHAHGRPGGHLPPSGGQRPGRHPDGARRRPVRRPPQPVRLLPLDHRLPDLRPATTSTSSTCAGT